MPVYFNPWTDEPLDDPYDRGYWSYDTGEPTPDRLDPERKPFLDGLATRLDEDRQLERGAQR